MVTVESADFKFVGIGSLFFLEHDVSIVMATITRVKTFFIRSDLNLLAFSKLVLFSQRGDTNVDIIINYFTNFLLWLCGQLYVTFPKRIGFGYTFKQNSLSIPLPYDYIFRH